MISDPRRRRNTWTEIGSYPPASLSKNRGRDPAGGGHAAGSTIGISDGITMGTQGRRRRGSREIIADSIELVTRANYFDGVIALSACDKTIPGTIMALLRLDIPSMMLYGGTIYPGTYQGQHVDIVSVYEAIGQYQTGKISEEELHAIESAACPGPGACGGQFTANTMGMISQIIGICPMGMADVPAETSCSMWRNEQELMLH
jgi:dihydroxy-acid dehydratase